MVDVKLFRQSEGYCGPACGVMAVRHYGMDISENSLAKIMEATRRDGVEGPKMLEGFRRIGFKGSFLEDNCFNAPRLKTLADRYPVLVDWTPEDLEEGHWGVLTSVDYDKLAIADPYLFDFRREDIGKFFEKWFDFAGQTPDENTNPYYYGRILVVKQ